MQCMHESVTQKKTFSYIENLFEQNFVYILCTIFKNYIQYKRQIAVSICDAFYFLMYGIFCIMYKIIVYTSIEATKEKHAKLLY